MIPGRPKHKKPRRSKAFYVPGFGVQKEIEILKFNISIKIYSLTSLILPHPESVEILATYIPPAKSDASIFTTEFLGSTL